MDEATQKECLVVLNRLRKRNTLRDFRTAKQELIGLSGYVGRVERPIDYREIEEALKSGAAGSPAQFARLMRRVGGNCLRFCVDKHLLQLRAAAKALLKAVDEEMEKELPGRVPPLHPDSAKCLRVLEQLLGQLVRQGKAPGLFWARLDQSLAGIPSLAAEYAAEVVFPMDCGRLTTELIEDNIPAPEFLAKAEIIFRNCRQFWGACFA